MISINRRYKETFIYIDGINMYYLINTILHGCNYIIIMRLIYIYIYIYIYIKQVLVCKNNVFFT